MGTLINVRRLLHLCMRFDMRVEVFFQRKVKRSVQISYHMGSWKWVRNTISNELKTTNECFGSSIYHFAAVWVNVFWKSINRIETSIRELDEHHKWKVFTWFLGSSPFFPSNFWISNGILTKMVGQNGSCWMGSFINLDRLGKSNVVKNGSFWLGSGYFWP